MALRKILKTVPATRAGPIFRLVGSVDFKGKGIKHPLECVDPVIMVDYTGSFSGKGMNFGILESKCQLSIISDSIRS